MVNNGLKYLKMDCIDLYRPIFRQTPCNHPHSVPPSICQFVATAEAQFTHEFWVLKWPSIRLKVLLFHPIAKYPWEFKFGCHGFSWRGNHSGQANHVFQVFVSAQGRICRWWHFRLDRNDARCGNWLLPPCKHGEQGSPFLWNGQFIYKSLHCRIWFPEGSSLILCLHFCFTSRLPVHLRHRLRCDIRYEDSGVGSPEDLWPLITSRLLSNRQLWKLRRLPPASERKKHVSCSRDARKEREKDGQVETLRVFPGGVETCDTRYTMFGHPATCIYMHLYASYFDVQILLTHSHASRCLMQTTKTEIVGLENLPITEVFGGSKPVPHFASLKSPCLTDPPFENCFTSPCLSVYTCLRPFLPVDIYLRCCCHAQVFWDLLLLFWLRINK